MVGPTRYGPNTAPRVGFEYLAGDLMSGAPGSRHYPRSIGNYDRLGELCHKRALFGRARRAPLICERTPAPSRCRRRMPPAQAPGAKRASKPTPLNEDGWAARRWDARYARVAAPASRSMKPGLVLTGPEERRSILLTCFTWGGGRTTNNIASRSRSAEARNKQAKVDTISHGAHAAKEKQ